MTAAPVLAATAWPTNAHMIEDVARLGYLHRDWRTVDTTYGRGTWWRRWRPDQLVAHDIRQDGVDFRHLPHGPRSFDVVCFDPPYKLNGTPSEPDERYGVHEPTRWQDRMELLLEGACECARVANRVLLVKCQDQVVSGRVVWQTREVASEVEAFTGHELVDRLDFLAYRPQPAGRRQVHARRNSSQLLVFKRSGQ